MEFSSSHVWLEGRACISMWQRYCNENSRADTTVCSLSIKATAWGRSWSKLLFFSHWCFMTYAFTGKVVSFTKFRKLHVGPQPWKFLMFHCAFLNSKYSLTLSLWIKFSQELELVLHDCGWYNQSLFFLSLTEDTNFTSHHNCWKFFSRGLAQAYMD